ncbi:MAG: methyltransferase domain-containing protein [Betaproteobacteria bacterium]
MNGVQDSLTPIHADAEANYARLAAIYDGEVKRMAAARKRAIEALDLRPGMYVLDVGCGTGLSLVALSSAVGPTGRVTGFELSGPMLAHAAAVVERHGLSNVTLCQSAGEHFTSDVKFDAALLCYTHDVQQSPAALAAIFKTLKVGARIVATGTKLLPAPVGWLLNGWLRKRQRGYNSNPVGLECPWRLLPEFVEADFSVRPYYAGLGYLFHGRVT